ncbi:MAG: hypothetical protein QCI82_05865 [Candidatus Thermoplasmatota archaeon]|nr:hypothetical protein [Candidatus Thermoplasmatota archaeon]
MWTETVVSLVLIVLGLVLAYRGYVLFKGVVSVFGALILGTCFLIAGIWIGGMVGGIFALLVPIALAIIGCIIGAILAVRIAVTMLGIAFAVISWTAGMAVGSELFDGGLALFVTALVFAMAAVALFIIFNKAMIKVATSVIGGYLTAWGAYTLMHGHMADGIAFLAGVVILIAVTVSGMVSQMGASSKRKKKDDAR